jgi:hypothetical protein
VFGASPSKAGDTALAMALDALRHRALRLEAELLFGLGSTVPGKLAPGIAGRLELALGLSLLDLGGTVPAA